MHVQFLNGTSQQQQWFREALAWSDVPPERNPPASDLTPHRIWLACSAAIEVEWVPSSEIPPAPGSGLQFLFAEVSTGGAPGTVVADMKIADDLDVFVSSRGEFNGEAFYKEVIVHEMTHVLQAEMSDLNRQKIIECFGGGNWDSGVWASRIQEADAETGKDLFALSTQRKFLNRTSKRLPEDQLEKWTAQHYTPNISPLTDPPWVPVEGELLVPHWHPGGGIPPDLIDPDPAPLPWDATTPSALPEFASDTWSAWEMEITFPHVIGGLNDGVSTNGFQAMFFGEGWGGAHTFRFTRELVDDDGLVIGSNVISTGHPVGWQGTAFGALDPDDPDLGTTVFNVSNVYRPAPHTLRVRFAFAGLDTPGALPSMTFEGRQFWVPRLDTPGIPPYPDYPDLGEIFSAGADAGTVRVGNVRVVGGGGRIQPPSVIIAGSVSSQELGIESAGASPGSHRR